MIKPKTLKRGDTIGIIAPSSPTRKEENIKKAIEVLEAQGFKVVVGDSCIKKYGYLSGSDETRAKDINEMFKNPKIDGIFCIRGGYGTPRILDMLDYKSIKENPKVFIGYSDITAIHIALNQKCNLVTIHGPMVVSDMIEDFDDFSKESYFNTITISKPIGELKNPRGSDIKSLVAGKAKGKIVGGNLSLIVATLGTPYEINTKGKLLFLEDIGEYTYRIDRMLTQLRLSKKLEESEGIILGDFKDCIPENEEFGLTLMEVFNDIIVPLNKPTIYDFKAGHCSPKLTIPFGVNAILDAEKCTVSITERALKE